VVTPSVPGGAVRGGEQGDDLGLVEVSDFGTLEALVRDGEHPLNVVGVFGMAVGRELEEGMDGG